MKAGSKIDLLVTEHVIKFIPWEEKRGEYTHVIFQKPNEREPYRRTRNWEEAKKNYRIIKFEDIDHRVHVIHGLKNYSSDISDSWQAAEKAHEEGIVIVIDGLHASSYKWETDESPPYNFKRHFGFNEASDFNDLARCICLVILKAKGIDIDVE